MVLGVSLITHLAFKIIELKKRDINKGFILLASDISYLMPYIDSNMNEDLLKKLSLPQKSNNFFSAKVRGIVTSYLAGGNELLAVRITSNPLIKFFCEKTELGI